MNGWQIVANIAPSFAVIVAIGAFIWEVVSSRRERAFSVFLRLLHCYDEIKTERRHKWKVIKEKAKEISDKTSSLDYLLKRVQQKEPLYAIEDGLLEDEIRSLNLLNGLCNYALKDEQKALILKASYASEISYYQNKYKNLLSIRNRVKQYRLFSIPRHDYLRKFQVGDYFEDINQNVTDV